MICRPQPEANRLADAFRAAGGDVRVLPMLIREPITDDPAIRTQILNIDEFEHVIAVSPYAARLLVDWLDTWWPQHPTGIQWYGVGAGTAAELQNAGLPTRQPDRGHTSEALLELDELQHLEHQKVLIVRGQEGRQLLPDTLQQRGARVTLLPLYSRFAPDYDGDTLNDCFNTFDPEVVVALSGETLNNLVSLSDNSGHNLKKTLVVVPVERIADQARAAGLRQTCIPGSLADSAIVEAVARQLSSPQ